MSTLNLRFIVSMSYLKVMYNADNGNLMETVTSHWIQQSKEKGKQDHASIAEIGTWPTWSEAKFPSDKAACFLSASIELTSVSISEFFAAKASARFDSTFVTSLLYTDNSCSSCFMRASYDLLSSLCERGIFRIKRNISTIELVTWTNNCTWMFTQLVRNMAENLPPQQEVPLVVHFQICTLVDEMRVQHKPRHWWNKRLKKHPKSKIVKAMENMEGSSLFHLRNKSVTSELTLLGEVIALQNILQTRSFQFFWVSCTWWIDWTASFNIKEKETDQEWSMQREKWKKKSQIVLEFSAYWVGERKNPHQIYLIC